MSKSKQFIYVLKLVPYLYDENNWTDKEEEIVDRHFKYLQELLSDGKLVLAGRTLNNNETTFGIVIFEAETEEEAQNIMKSDPAVAAEIMTAELHPYRVALIRE